jgi:meso-butanediol dehydrogenase/(S,S)-butanediol dehydrogenase/diacetyl reductase
VSARGRLEGKRVLISGTARGIGAASQRLFCEEGAIVVGCALSEGGAERTAQELTGLGLAAHGRQVDLADPVAAGEWIDWGAELMGGVDVLYNNAGAAQIVPFADMQPDHWHATIQRELDIYFYSSSAAWPHLCRNGGVIINTASVCATTADPTLGFAAHAAAKGGVLAFSRQLASEGAAHGVRVNSISPGFVDSATTVVPDFWRARVLKRLNMLPTIAEPLDVARLALYLASDDSRMVTGANFAIDAGWSAGGQ